MVSPWEVGTVIHRLARLVVEHRMTLYGGRGGKKGAKRTVFVLREHIGGGKPYPLYLHRASTLAGAIEKAEKAMGI